MHGSHFTIAFLSLLHLTSAARIHVAVRWPRYFKRDDTSPIEAGPLADAHPAFPQMTPPPVIDPGSKELEKRDGTTSWFAETLAPFMATPGGSCRAGGSTSTLCPVGYDCACQVPGSSRCLTTTIAGLGAGCSSFAGAVPQPATTTWNLGSATLTNFATPWGQCGGTTPTAGTSWNTAKTECPLDQLCSCQNIYYSQCIPVTEVRNGGDCPANRNECPTDGPELPPPTATASLWSQCGGTCWTGPTRCPTVNGTPASCWTETSPNPGGYAMCDTTRPAGGRYVRRAAAPTPGAVFGLPPQVRAIVTAVGF